jgi:eight-cysteine-cluster-containing protein
MKSYIIALVVVVLVIVAASLIYIKAGDKIIDDKYTPNPSHSVTPVPTQPNINDTIYLENPSTSELDSVKSPLTVTGKARGSWYFEASFPVKVYDANDKLLGSVPAQAQGDWMTTEFVPFLAVVSFTKPTTETGFLVLEKDNPSGLAENDAQLRIPIKFNLQTSQSAVAECKVTGCSGQICADEDVVTTCEYKPEYACYKTAKCERQEDGKCGWTPSEDLVACLYNAWGTEQPK